MARELRYLGYELIIILHRFKPFFIKTVISWICCTVYINILYVTTSPYYINEAIIFLVLATLFAMIISESIMYFKSRIEDGSSLRDLTFPIYPSVKYVMHFLASFITNLLMLVIVYPVITKLIKINNPFYYTFNKLFLFNLIINTGVVTLNGIAIAIHHFARTKMRIIIFIISAFHIYYISKTINEAIITQTRVFTLNMMFLIIICFISSIISFIILQSHLLRLK